MNKSTIKEFVKLKFIEGTEGYEIVVMLLALVSQGKLKEDDILDIMNYTFDNNLEGVTNALIKAKAIANDDIILKILEGVE